VLKKKEDGLVDHDKTSRLRENYQRLTLAFKAIGGGVWDYDVASGTLHGNHRWHEILGVDNRHHPITSIEAFKPHIHPEDVEAATRVDLAELNRLVARHERYIAEFRIVRPDGEIRWVRSVACMVRRKRRQLRAIGCLTDITELHLHDLHNGDGAPTDHDDEHVHHSALPPIDVDEPVALSDRERECLLWVSFGKTAWETAAILSRSQRTVEFHLNNAVRKLHAANKVHAAVLAIRLGLL
jgi:PAS domain S-box-containing protein